MEELVSPQAQPPGTSNGHSAGVESLPVVDYSGESRADIAGQVIHVLETVGFFFLDNVPGYSEDDLRWCVEFFYDVMPAEKKLQVARILYNSESNNVYRGYYPTNKLGDTFKEGYDIGQDLPKDDPDYESSYPVSEHSPWPRADSGEDSAPYKKFKRTVLHYHSLLLEVGLGLMRFIAMGLGLNEHYFNSLFTKSVSTLRLLNYPVHNFNLPRNAYTGDGKLLSTEPHTDTSILTLLTTFDYEGLQVEGKDGSWLDVIPRKNSLIVNIGAILSKMTKGQLKATTHRVLAIGRIRKSVPFFFEPSYYALLPNNLPDDKTMKSAGDYSKEDSIQYGPRPFHDRIVVEWKGFFSAQGR